LLLVQKMRVETTDAAQANEPSLRSNRTGGEKSKGVRETKRKKNVVIICYGGATRGTIFKLKRRVR